MDVLTDHVPDARVTVEPLPWAQVPGLPELLDALGLGGFAPAGPASHPGRNDNWAGRTTAGREVFIKRLNGPRDEVQARFDRSLRFEELVAAHEFAGFRSPRLLGADRAAGLMVFERIADATAVPTLLIDGEFDTALAARIGRALGELHSRPAPAASTGAKAGSAGQRMTALSIDEYAMAAGGELEAWTLLQHDSGLAAALQRLGERSAAAEQVPTHTDIRLDQFLLSGDQLFLVDWEEFRAADAALDAGGVAGQLLHRAATQMFTGLDAKSADVGAAHLALVSKGEQELALVRPLISAFWAGYREARPQADADLAVRTTAYAGWHLYDRLLSQSMFSAKLSAAQRGAAGIGRNALLAPETFAEALGLSEK